MLKVNHLSKRLLGRRFFYGWIIVLNTFVAGMITAGIHGYGLSFFVLPMSQELGISRAEFSGVTIFRLFLLPLAPFLGLLVDKEHGPRLMLVFGGIAAGATLMLSSAIHSLWQFYLFFGVIFGLAMMAMGGFLLAPSVISKWFIRKRGKAMAIGTMGMSAGGFIIAPLTGLLVVQFGWRTAWIALGILVMVGISPISALFMRRSPEDMGLTPDGDPPSNAPDSQEGDTQTATWADAEYSWTVRQALRTPTLWVLLVVQTLGGAALSPVLFHQVAYIQDKGFGLSTATAVATLLGLVSFLSKILWAYLSDRIHIRWSLALCLIPSGFTLFLLVQAQSLPMLYAYAILYGFSMGGWVPLISVAWAAYFGRRHTGAIRGVVTPVGGIVSAITPIFAGWVRDHRGSYDLAFATFGIAWAVAGLLVLLARTPKTPVSIQSKLSAASGQ